MSDITPADALRELGDDQAEYAAAAAKKLGLPESKPTADFETRLKGIEERHRAIAASEAVADRQTADMAWLLDALRHMTESWETAEQAIKENERLHSWGGLLSLLDEHWPEDVFPDRTGKPARDTGPRLVAAIRRAEKAKTDLAAAVARIDEIEKWATDHFGDSTEFPTDLAFAFWGMPTAADLNGAEESP